MSPPLGIRREDKNDWEARTPLTPGQAGRLVAGGIPVVVQPSSRRCFPDDAYAQAGAVVREDISDCVVVLGVKEIPVGRLDAGRTYVYFSHTIKGQPYNMPMLRHILAVGANLLDYERVTDDAGRRLIAFGLQAGQAGMIDSLAALGRRLAAEGIATPLADLEPAWHYGSLDEALRAVRDVGRRLATSGPVAAVGPIAIGVLGHGRVARGTWDVLEALGTRQIAPAGLADAVRTAEPHAVLECRLARADYLERREDGGFDAEEYERHPERYVSALPRLAGLLTVLVNGIYWEPRFPRLLTRDDFRRLYGGGSRPRLRVVGDITCDIRGALACTVRATTPAAPTYVYDPERDAALDEAVDGPGPLVMAVDNLPCELPREASESFGAAPLPRLPDLVQAHPDGRLDAERLSPPWRRALIACGGRLTEDYRYLEKFLENAD